MSIRELCQVELKLEKNNSF